MKARDHRLERKTKLHVTALRIQQLLTLQPTRNQDHFLRKRPPHWSFLPHMTKVCLTKCVRSVRVWKFQLYSGNICSWRFVEIHYWSAYLNSYCQQRYIMTKVSSYFQMSQQLICLESRGKEKNKTDGKQLNKLSLIF